MMISRTLSTCVFVAASISRTSMSRPCAISTQASHVAARLPGRSRFAVQASRENACGRRLSHPARAGKDERLRDALRRDGVAQSLRDAALSDDILEPLRAPFARQNLVVAQCSMLNAQY